MISERTLDEIRRNWRRAYPPDKHGGIICPICNNGAGETGTGIEEFDPIGKPGLLKCLKCGWSGDVISLYCNEMGLDLKNDFAQVTSGIASRCGVTIEKEENASYRVEKRRKALTSIDIDNVTAESAKGFAKTDGETLGSAREGDFSYLQKRGISIETQKHFNITFVNRWKHPKAPAKAHFKPVVIIPVIKGSYIARDTRDIKNIPAADKKYIKQNVGKVATFNFEALFENEDVFVVEGAIDAMSIYDVGFHGVVAINSIASVPRFIKELREMPPAVRPKRLYIALDNEDQEAVKLAKKKLMDFICTLGGMLAVDAQSLSEPEKDANDLLQKDRQRLIDNLNALVDSARTTPIPAAKTNNGRKEMKEVYSDEAIEGCPAHLLIPPKFNVDDEGVWSKEDDEAAALTPVFPVKIVKSYETGRVRYEIIFRNDDGTWEQIDVDADAISDSTKALTLAARGIRTYTGATKYLVEYMNTCLAVNRDVIPTITEFAQPGWHNNFADFVLPDYRGCFLPTLADALTVKGDFETWRDSARKIFNNDAHPLPRIILSSAVVGVILPILDMRSFCLYVWGPSGVGKTALQRLALSVWGNPTKLLQTFNTTKNGIEAGAVKNNNLLLALDERQAADQKLSLKQIAYNFALEQSRGRMDKTLKKRPTVMWRELLLMSGEDKLFDESVDTGAFNRTIELPIDADETIFEPAIFGSVNFPADIHRLAGKHFGHAGRHFIDQLLAFNDANEIDNFENIHAYYSLFYQQIADKSSIYGAAAINNIPVLATAELLFGAFCLDMADEELIALTKTISEKDVPYLLHRQPSANAIDSANRAFNHICEFVERNIHHFIGNPFVKEGDEDIIRTEIYGYVKVSDTPDALKKQVAGAYLFDEVGIFPTVVRAELKKEGFAVDRCIRDWATRKMIVTEASGVNPKRKVDDGKGNVTRQRMITIDGVNFRRKLL